MRGNIWREAVIIMAGNQSCQSMAALIFQLCPGVKIVFCAGWFSVLPLLFWQSNLVDEMIYFESGSGISQSLLHFWNEKTEMSMDRKCLHSVIFSKLFILVKVAEDPELILITLGTRWENSLQMGCQSSAGHHLHMQSHTYSYLQVN